MDDLDAAVTDLVPLDPRMLSEKIDASLPQARGFLRSYVEYAAQCSDAPEIYHVGVGLTVLAGAVSRKLPCPWMAGRTLLPNLYTLLVGPSRSSRKTGSMDIGIDILANAKSELVIPIPGSYEEMVSQIRSTPNGVLTYREFGHFLKTTARGYGEPIRTVLMDLYDFPPDRAYTRNLKKGKTVIEPPISLSMLSSIATDLLFAYCVDDETEILTADGWKHRQDVVTGDECYTLNHDTGLGEWQRISKISVFDGHPDREMVHMEGRGHSSMTTPNHRWPVRSKGNSSWSRRWRTTEALNQSDNILCAARDAGLPAEKTYSDAFVEIAAWTWTEGSWNPSSGLALCQSSRVNAPYCERIRQALTTEFGPPHGTSMWKRRHEGIPLWTESPAHPDGKVNWSMNQAASARFVEVMSIPEKVISYTWLRKLTQEQLELFIDVSLCADGHKKRNRLAQAVEARAEAFAFACILAGRPVSYRPHNNPAMKLEIGVLRRKQFSPISNSVNGDDRPFFTKRVKHAGPVWCPTTPNGSWLARRKGTVYWTGNTDSEEWTGGFFGRMLLLYGEREDFKMPVTWPAARQYLIGVLGALAAYPFHACGGFSPQAWLAFEQWSRSRDAQSTSAPSRMQTHIAGCSTLAAKVALLYAADQGECMAGNGWLVSYEAMSRAILLVEHLYLPSVNHIGERLALGFWEKDRQRVLDVISSRKGMGITGSDLLRIVKMHKDHMHSILETLREERTIVQQGDASRGIVFRVNDPNAPAAKVIHLVRDDHQLGNTSA